MIKSVNFVVLGEQSIANDFGKKGTSTDMTLFDKKESDIIRTWITPNGFPDKIQPLFQEINKLEPIPKEGKTKIVIDHCFDVKGVGTIVLGKVTQGKVMQYDNLKLFPNGTDVMIKSIQMHDDPVDEATSPARVGLSVKGITVDDVNRGDYLCQDDSQTIQ